MLKGQNRNGFLLLALLLLVLAGCVTTGKQEPEPQKEEVAVAEEGPTVTQLTDGREGFIIKETPHLEKEAVDKFDQAVALMEKQEYEEAADLLETVIEDAPEVTAPYIDLAIACRQLGRLEEAEEYLETALELVPGHPVASNEYGLLLRKAGRFEEARKIYEQSLANFPDYQPVRRNLGILCDLYLRDPACALEQYEIYSKAMPKDEKVKLWIADLQMRLKK
ncbi:MAG: tetratricopeptide repeat protein [Deltaproteobacteria bacterium]